MTTNRSNYEMSVEQVAANVTYLSDPAFSDTTLTLPAVPEGFTIAIKSSSHPEVIDLDGTIHLPDEETEVTLVLTVTKESDGSTADTKAFTVTVAARPAYYPWEIIREDSSAWKYVDDTSDAISIKQTLGSHWDNSEVRGHNMFVVEPDAADPDNYTITVQMTGATTYGYEQAGLIIYKDDNNFVQVARMHKAGNPLLAMNNRSGGGSTVDVDGSISAYNQETIYLRIVKTGSTFKGYASSDGITWDPIGTCTNASLENARVGVFSSSEDTDDWFTFDEFKVDNREISFRYTESALSGSWRILRENTDGWTIPDETQNQLDLTPMGGTLAGADTNNSQNVFLTAGPQGAETAAYTTTVEVTGVPEENGESVGLVFYSTDDRFLSVTRTKIDGVNYIAFISEDNGVPTTLKVEDPGDETIYLSLSRNLEPIDSYTASYSLDGETWIPVGTQQNTAVYSNEIGILADGAATGNAFTFQNFRLNGRLISFIPAEEPEEPVAVEGVEVEPAQATLTVGETLLLTAKITPEDAADQRVSWSSEDGLVAMVDASGNVTALAPGETTIRVTTMDGGKTATCTVTVKAAEASSHTITLDPNGGSVSEKTLVVKDGKTVDLPTPDRSGNYRFLGWFDEKGEQVTSETPITRDMTLTAHWQYTGGGTHVDPEEPENPVEPTEPEGYVDVTVGDWYYDAVSYVSENGLMTGVGNGKFNPDGAVTRAMVWTVLARMDGENTEGGATWYSKAQSWAMRTGVSDGTNPMGSITREQLAAMLYRYEGSPAVSGNLCDYPDANSVSDWAVDAMVWATEEGIINGMDGYLKPQDGATRAQLAAMLMRFTA